MIIFSEIIVCEQYLVEIRNYQRGSCSHICSWINIGCCPPLCKWYDAQGPLAWECSPGCRWSCETFLLFCFSSNLHLSQFSQEWVSRVCHVLLGNANWLCSGKEFDENTRSNSLCGTLVYGTPNRSPKRAMVKLMISGLLEFCCLRCWQERLVFPHHSSH